MKKYLLFGLAALISAGFVSCSDENEKEDYIVPVVEDDAPSTPVPAKGFYVANEDWFGHDNGTMNYFKYNGNEYEPIYRVYRAANPGETLGATTQFGTTWGDYIYLLSKQGNRLVIADAGTLKKKVVFTEIGGDGRAFVGVNDTLGYVGHSSGIRQFDIAKMQLGKPVDGISGEIGALCFARGRVFAVASKKVYVIDITTNQVEKTLDGSFYTLTCSKDGTVWIAASDKFIKMNPVTLETEDMAYPEGVSVASPWGAWNAGSLCASTQKNVLYWAKGSSWGASTIVKYDIDSQTFNETYHALGKKDDKAIVLYGAGLRVDPLTDNVIATCRRDGFGDSYMYHWIRVLSPDGNLLKEITLKGGGENNESEYYWFPAVPFFEDANKPEILINQILVAPSGTKTVDLTKAIVDADNISASIICEVEFAKNNLVAYSLNDGILTVTAREHVGSTECKVIAISNGKRVEKKVQVDVAYTK